MKQCPKCGGYLRFKLVYNCGTPIVGWDCVCGYDSFKEKHTIITTNTINIKEKEIYRYES